MPEQCLSGFQINRKVIQVSDASQITGLAGCKGIWPDTGTGLPAGYGTRHAAGYRKFGQIIEIWPIQNIVLDIRIFHPDKICFKIFTLLLPISCSP